MVQLSRLPREMGERGSGKMADAEGGYRREGGKRRRDMEKNAREEKVGGQRKWNRDWRCIRREIVGSVWKNIRGSTCL